MRQIITTGVITALSAVTISLFYFAFGYLTPAGTVHSRENILMPVPEAVAESLHENYAMPHRLIIPGIGVDAPIVAMGLTDNGMLPAPHGPYEVAWFSGGAYPGQNGSAILAGHYGRWQTGENSIFDDLHRLSPGDTVSVYNADGSEHTFVIETAQIYGKDDVVNELYRSDGKYLNIITCNGTWLEDEKTYDRRLVVFARLVDDK